MEVSADVEPAMLCRWGRLCDDEVTLRPLGYAARLGCLSCPTPRSAAGLVGKQPPADHEIATKRKRNKRNTFADSREPLF